MPLIFSPRVLALACCLVASASAPAADLTGRWRIAHGMVAPWVAEDAAQPDRTALLGKTVEFTGHAVHGPGVLNCENAEFARDTRALAGLFQGNLPDPAENAAGSLGLTNPEIESITLTCDTGLFDLHVATPDAVLLALDNVIWVLDRSPGALAAEGTPEFALQRFLEAHFRDGLEFTAERSESQRTALSDRLAGAVQRYFAQDFPDDEAPPINGDPYTDSQEYPTQFSVRNAVVTGDRARVPVRYDYGYESRTIHFILVRRAGRWLIDDVDYERDEPLSKWLEAKPGE